MYSSMQMNVQFWWCNGLCLQFTNNLNLQSYQIVCTAHVEYSTLSREVYTSWKYNLVIWCKLDMIESETENCLERVLRIILKPSMKIVLNYLFTCILEKCWICRYQCNDSFTFPTLQRETLSRMRVRVKRKKRKKKKKRKKRKRKQELGLVVSSHLVHQSSPVPWARQ